jgi:nucleoside-diphosphate-sugar epimerase
VRIHNPKLHLYGSMNSVLITGASGFIGGHLAEALTRRGVHVRCLVRSTSRLERLEPLGAELVVGDVTDPQSLRAAVAGVDTVFHLAGLTCALRRKDLFRVNAQGPEHVARVCAACASPPVHVLVSSIAASGPGLHGGPRVEADRPAPVSYYGRSKLAGELAARSWADRVPTTVVRPGVVFGEYDPGMLPVLKTLRRARLHLNAGLLSPRLSCIYAADLVEILIRAAEQGERLPAHGMDGQGTYFGVSPEYPTYSQLGRMLINDPTERRQAVTLYIPSLIAWMIAGVYEAINYWRGRPDLLNTDKIREALVYSWVCSSDKVRDQLRFRPAQPLAEQLLATARWYREHGWL